MKKFLSVFILTSTLLSGNSYAQQDNGLCLKFGEWAEVVMKSRQNNVALDDMLKAHDRVILDRKSRSAKIDAPDEIKKEYNEKTAELERMILVDGYQAQKLHTENARREAISEFKNKWLLICLSSRN